jgi:hypothetical protein
MTDLTRRNLIGAAATIAAATAAVVSLPATVQAAQPKPQGLSTWRDPAIMAREHELERRFEATLTPAQADLWMQLSDTRSDQILAEQERFVGALGEHLPGLAKAIEIVAFGRGDIITGRCCEAWYI